MSFASCSSSCSAAFRSAVRTTTNTGTTLKLSSRASSSRQAAQICRNYATTTGSTPNDLPASSTIPLSYTGLGDASNNPSSSPSKTSGKADRPKWKIQSDQPSYNDAKYRGSSSLTGPKAQEYLAKLLRLPATNTFSEKLALQILTHKSYRYNHVPRSLSTLSPPPTAAEAEAQYAAHNARLSFLGRRALATYLTMFLHASAATHGTTIAGMGLLLPGEDLTVKVNNLMHVSNVGRTVGIKWGMDKIARWDGNPNTDGLRIYGTTVQAIVGAVYTEFGSPAAHRLFHLYYLPMMAWQLRDPALIERVEVLRKDLDSQLGGSILLTPNSEISEVSSESDRHVPNGEAQLVDA